MVFVGSEKKKGNFPPEAGGFKIDF